MDLDAFIPYQVCINLDRRPDRWDRMRRRLGHAGLRLVVRFPAIDGGKEQRPEVWAERPGAFGCLRSHLEVVRAARRAKMPSVLILEDDAELADNWRQRLAAAWSSLSADWDVLYLGCNHLVPPVPVANGLARVVQAHSTFAYILRESAYNAFLDVNRQSDRPLDVNLLRLQRDRACYALWPNAAWVDEGHSDVQQSHESYWYLRESVLVTPEALLDLKGQLLLVVPLTSTGWRAATPETVIFQVRQFTLAFPWLDVALGVDQPAGRARAGEAILAALAREVDLPRLRALPGLQLATACARGGAKCTGRSGRRSPSIPAVRGVPCPHADTPSAGGRADVSPVRPGAPLSPGQVALADSDARISRRTFAMVRSNALSGLGPIGPAAPLVVS